MPRNPTKRPDPFSSFATFYITPRPGTVSGNSIVVADAPIGQYGADVVYTLANSSTEPLSSFVNRTDIQYFHEKIMADGTVTRTNLTPVADIGGNQLKFTVNESLSSALFPATPDGTATPTIVTYQSRLSWQSMADHTLNDQPHVFADNTFVAQSARIYMAFGVSQEFVVTRMNEAAFTSQSFQSNGQHIMATLLPSGLLLTGTIQVRAADAAMGGVRISYDVYGVSSYPWLNPPLLIGTLRDNIAFNSTNAANGSWLTFQTFMPFPITGLASGNTYMFKGFRSATWASLMDSNEVTIP